MNFTFEAALGALLSLGLLAIALVPAPQPSYAGVSAALAASDALEVLEKNDVLLQAAYGTANGEPGSFAVLAAFAQQAQGELGLACISLSSGGVPAASGCRSGQRQVVLRRLLFDGTRFFFFEVRVGY